MEQQGPPHLNQDRFLAELDFITKKCAEMAQEYALLKGAMNSLSGLEDKFPRGASMDSPAIRFFNETKNLRVNRLVGVVWAMSERMAPARINQSSLSGSSVKKLPARLDAHKFSGDMTLMRMRDMYRRAVQLYPEILHHKARVILSYMEEPELNSLVEASKEKLVNLCNQIDSHLLDDDAWGKIEHFRGTFAHSIKFPNVAIINGWTELSPDYKYNELYEFGDRAAKIAIEFRRAWSFSETCSGVDELVEMIEDEYGEFWQGYFGNPLFYDDGPSSGAS